MGLLNSTKLWPAQIRCAGTESLCMRTLFFWQDDIEQACIEQALKARRHDVQVCSDVEAAWQAYTAKRHPLVVLMYGGEAALDLCRRIRSCETGDATTVVAVLKEAATEPLQTVLDAGVDDYLLVTLSPERLNARLAFVERNAHVKTRRVLAEAELAGRARQQAVVAELGQRALAGEELPALMDFAVKAVAEALGVTHTKVLEKVDAHTFLMRAGHGWKEGTVGRATVGTHAASQAGYTLLATAPVVVEDLAREERFKGAALLHDHGIVSGLSVVIGGEREPYGVLSAHTTEPRSFKDHDINFLQSVANVLADTIDRRQNEDALRESEARVRAILETTVDAIITSDAAGIIQSFNSAAEQIFGYRASEVIGRNLKILMPSPYREEHDGYIRSYHETGRRKIIGIGREVTGQRKDGSTFPMDLAVSEVRLEDRVLFTGIIRDITERRRLEQEILQISDEERRRIGQDLHDGLGQMLTGIGLISQNLARKLKANGMPGADDVSEITDLIREADQFARTPAKGLVPVELEANGLSAALQHLTANAERLFGISCAFEEVGSVPIDETAAAVHLYRIAQEAVSNAVKHGKASHVKVSLAQGDEQVRLYVQDDGIGFPDALPKSRGMGVRIMQYRARIIGATLEIWRDPAGGTVVTCTLPRKNRSSVRAAAHATTGRKTKRAQTP